MRGADQRLGLQRIADLGDLHVPPQHGYRGDRESGAPGAEQRQRRLDEIGELQDDPVPGLEPELDEEPSERVDCRVRLPIGERARTRKAKPCLLYTSDAADDL